MRASGGTDELPRRYRSCMGHSLRTRHSWIDLLHGWRLEGVSVGPTAACTALLRGALCSELPSPLVAVGHGGYCPGCRVGGGRIASRGLACADGALRFGSGAGACDVRPPARGAARSEERRVGKGRSCGGSAV